MGWRKRKLLLKEVCGKKWKFANIVHDGVLFAENLVYNICYYKFVILHEEWNLHNIP